MTKLINLHAAGIDISAKEYVVAVPEETDQKETVRLFKTFTRDLFDLVNWLNVCGIQTVAMESTGVYWYHLYTILIDHGFEVYLVNAAHVKNVPGRKSDISDARWIQQLHCYGLLRGCFQPDNQTRMLRNYVRQRKVIIKQMSTEVQRMQKSLEQMNIKLNNVIRDLTGKTGMCIIEKILQGERSAKVLAGYRDYRVKASEQTIIKSLEGNWREEQLFNLAIAYEHYKFLQQQLIKCDQHSEKIVSQMTEDVKREHEITQGRRVKNQPKFNVENYLYKSLGVDVMQIYGLKSTTALTVFSETGPNLKQKFPTEKQFLSWLNVVPDNKITGGKVISSRVRRKKNKAGQAFREAANALWIANNPLADYLRSKKAKSGSRQAVVATARKIAAIYYKMVTEKVSFNPDKLLNTKQNYLQNKLRYLEKTIIQTKILLFENQLVT